MAVDLKDRGRSRPRCAALLAKADVLIQNFRPGVIERLGLDYEAVQAINPRLVYASISGYGEEGPWVKRPGQDLLAQARSGVMWLNGDEDQGPVPFGLAIGDMLAGAAAAQGILAALVRRGVTRPAAAHVETSLLEALVDFQFEVLTTHLNDGRRLPRRSSFRSAHAYLSAPYGVYPAKDGYPGHRHDADPASSPTCSASRQSSRPIATSRRPGSRRATRSRRSSPSSIATRRRSTNGLPSSSLPTSGAPRC